MPDDEIRLRRTVHAPVERVYRAWLDPEVMKRWFAPAGYTVGEVVVDERVGGRMRIQHLDDGTEVGGAEAEILDLVPDERIVLRWWFVYTDQKADPEQASRLTITFTPSADGSTDVELVHDQLDGLRAHHPEIADNVEGGWTGTLGVLAGQLED